MTAFKWIGAAALVAFLSVPTPATGTNAITGFAKVIDGDTIEIAGERIRLHGADAPTVSHHASSRGARLMNLGENL